MQLQSKIEPIFFPDAEQSTVMHMGLQPLRKDQWMMVDKDLPQFLAHKLQQAELQPDRVYQYLPQSAAAQEEFVRTLHSHLMRDHGYSINTGNSLTHPDYALEWDNSLTDLWHSSLLIQEDICILELIDDNYCLTAASVCSPSNWKMEEKIGCTVDVIHDPVPGYQDEMAAKVNRLLHGIKVDKPVQRLNWSIQPGADLFWRGDLKDYSGVNDKYWRVERQTLLRLPETQAIYGLVISIIILFVIANTFIGLL